MNLFKKIHDDEKKHYDKEFSGGVTKESIVDMLVGGEKGGLDADDEIAQIEKRRLELNDKILDLANKHRKNFDKSNLITTGYRMPDAYDEEQDLKEAGLTTHDKRMQALTKRYED
mmetsp:Transcript_19656/g.30333  ORF Transcript_19656/g.30333 Transcript_19656/m.30333 type:complete len:115 (+) Transcript_19656:445-789(+)